MNDHFVRIGGEPVKAWFAAKSWGMDSNQGRGWYLSIRSWEFGPYLDLEAALRAGPAWVEKVRSGSVRQAAGA